MHLFYNKFVVLSSIKIAPCFGCFALPLFQLECACFGALFQLCLICFAVKHTEPCLVSDFTATPIACIPGDGVKGVVCADGDKVFVCIVFACYLSHGLPPLFAFLSSCNCFCKSSIFACRRASSGSTYIQSIISSGCTCR